MIFLRKTLITLVSAYLFVFSGSVSAQSNSPSDGLPELTNLQTLSQQAKTDNLPIMLMFGAEWCEFCHQLQAEVLNPMYKGGLYEGKYVYMRHVGIDLEPKIALYDGRKVHKRDWADEINSDLTPTVIFMDGLGREVGPRIVGIANVELFSTLIHKSLNVAYKNLRNPIRLPAMPEDLIK